MESKMLPQRLDHRQFSVFSIELPSLSAKNSISASDSSLAENPIKAWAFHTPTLSRRGRLWTPDYGPCTVTMGCLNLASNRH